MMRYWTNFWMNNTNNNINNSINLINDNNIYNNNNSSAQSNFVQYFWIFESTAKIRTSRKQTMTIYTKRLGLQCWTPLRSYPLTLDSLSLIPTHCPLSPCTFPSKKNYVGVLVVPVLVDLVVTPSFIKVNSSS